MTRFWKVYFFLWIFIEGTNLYFSIQIGLLVESFPYTHIFNYNLITQILATIALYCYAWQKRFWPQYVWKIVFILYFVIFIYDLIVGWEHSYNIFGSKDWDHDLTAYFLLIIPALISTIIFNSLFIIGIFLYAFNSYETNLRAIFTGKREKTFKIILFVLFSFSSIFLVRTYYKGYYSENSRMYLMLEQRREELNRKRNSTNKLNWPNSNNKNIN